MPKPVIFLAFANDLMSPTRNLKALSVEEKGILRAFEDHPLVDIVVDDNASIDSIIRTFEKEKYRGRIAVFHYGGHADGFQLMLEKADGDHEIAHGSGLVEFFALQKSLKLIFLNGCSTERLALDMNGKGLPMVVGTSQSINDTIATNLSIDFYQSLARGNSLGRAWDTAIAQVQMATGVATPPPAVVVSPPSAAPADEFSIIPDEEIPAEAVPAEAPAQLTTAKQAEAAAYRSLYWDGMDQSIVPDRFPWSLHIRPGAEAVRDWNLPEAAEDLTFGLPPIPAEIGIPAASPFMMLSRYERDQARVFLGRSKYVRDLYEKVTTPGAPPVLLLYGQTGAGKSSLLEAGLRPRLEGRTQEDGSPGSDYEVRYVRRNQTKGLLGTLTMSLRYVELGKKPQAVSGKRQGEAEKPQGSGEQKPEPITTESLERADAWEGGKAAPPAPAPSPLHDTIAQIESLIQTLEPDKRAVFESLLKTLKAQEEAKLSASQPTQRKALDIFATGSKATGATLRQAWLEIEKQTGRKLVVVLDQVEEAFTQPMSGATNADAELLEFAQAMAEIFGNPSQRPAGRLILGYRKEYHPDLSKIFRDSQVPAIEVYLEQLSRSDIKDILKGLSPADPTSLIRLTYNLSIQDGVADSIAEGLYQQKDAAIGPILQILLVNMWTQAKRENSAAPLFSRAMFEEMQRNRLGMEAFYFEQMATLASERPDLVQSGLALEVMGFHVTENGTSARRSTAEVRSYFVLGKFGPEVLAFFTQAEFSIEKRSKDIDWLLKRMQEVSLLGASGAYTTLIHDTLAPVVMTEYARSTRNGQRALRVITTQTPLYLASMQTGDGPHLPSAKSLIHRAWERLSHHDESKEQPDIAPPQQRAEVILEDGELEVIEAGLQGMRLLLPDEQKLLIHSLAKQEERRIRRRQLMQTGLMTVIAFLFISILALISWQSAQNKKVLLSVTNAHYQSQDLESQGTPESRRLALGLAEQAFSKSVDKPIDIVQHFYTLTGEEMRRDAQRGDKTAFTESPYGIYLDPGKAISSFYYDGVNGALTGHPNGTAHLWNFAGKDLQTYRHGKAVSDVRFSPDGLYVATFSGENRQRLYQIHNRLITAPVVKVMRRPGKNEQNASGTVTTYTNGLEQTYNPASGVLIEKDPVSGMERTYSKSTLTEYYPETAQKFVYHRAKAMLTQYEYSDSVVYRYSLKTGKRYEIWRLADFAPDSLIGPYTLMDLGQKKEYVYDGNGKVMSATAMDASGQESVQAGLKNFRTSVDGLESILSDYDSHVQAITVKNTPLVIGEYDYFRGEFTDVHGQVFSSQADFEKAWIDDLRAAYQSEYRHIADSLYVEGASRKGIEGMFGVKLWDESLERLEGAKLRNIPYPKALVELKRSLGTDTLHPICVATRHTYSERNGIKLWLKKDGTLLREYEVNEGIYGLLLLADNGTFATFDGNGVCIWDADQFSRPQAEIRHRQPLIDVSLAPDRQHIITRTGDSVALWTTEGKQVSRYACQQVRTLNDGIAFVGDQEVKLYKPYDGKTFTLPHAGLKGLALSPASGHLLTWSGQQVKVWSAEGKDLFSVSVPATLYRADFMADGRHFTAVSRDTVYCWSLSVKAGRGDISLLSRKFPFEGGAVDATVTPDLERALTISPNQVVSVWDDKGRLRNRWTAEVDFDEDLILGSTHSNKGNLVRTEDLVVVSLTPARDALVVRDRENLNMQWLDFACEPIEAFEMNSGYKLGFREHYFTHDGQYYIAASPKEIFLWRKADTALFSWLLASGNTLTADEKADYGLANIDDRIHGTRTKSELALALLMVLSVIYLIGVYVRRQFKHFIEKRHLAMGLYTGLYALFFATAFVAWSYTPDAYMPFFGMFVGISGIIVAINSMWINAGNEKRRYFFSSGLMCLLILACMGLYLYLTPIARIGWGLLANFTLALLVIVIFVLPVYWALKKWYAGKEAGFYGWLLIPAGAIITILAVFFGSVNVYFTRTIVTFIAVVMGLIIGYLQIRRYRKYNSYVRIAVYTIACLLVLFTRTYDSPFDTGLYLAAALCFIRAVRNYQDEDWGWAFGDILAGVVILAGMIPVAYAPISTAYLLDIPIITLEALVALTGLYWICRLYDTGKITERKQIVFTVLLLIALATFAFTHRSIRLDPNLRASESYFQE